jgi:hypothetical protein
MIAYFISKIGDFINCFKPDLVIVFGDVDTTLAASIAAIKKLVKIIHIPPNILQLPEAVAADGVGVVEVGAEEY